MTNDAVLSRMSDLSAFGIPADALRHHPGLRNTPPKPWEGEPPQPWMVATEITVTYLVRRAGIRWALVREVRFSSPTHGWVKEHTDRRYWTRSAAEACASRANRDRIARGLSVDMTG